MSTPAPSDPPTTWAGAGPEEFASAAYRAIGKFIVEYAQAEWSLAFTLDRFLQRRFFKRSYSHEGVQILAALFGGLQMEKLRHLSKDLAVRAGCSPEDTRLIEESSAQLKSLQEFRNRIAHYGAHPAGNYIQTSNKYNVRDYDKREIWRYSIETLDAASRDMLRCVFRISHALFPEDREVLQREAKNYDPLARFEFRWNEIVREAMPLTRR